MQIRGIIDSFIPRGPICSHVNGFSTSSLQIIVGISQNDGYGYFKQSDGDDFTTSLDDVSSIETENSFLIAVDRFVDAFYNRTELIDGVDIVEVVRKMIEYVYKDSATK